MTKKVAKVSSALIPHQECCDFLWQVFGLMLHNFASQSLGTDCPRTLRHLFWPWVTGAVAQWREKGARRAPSSGDYILYSFLNKDLGEGLGSTSS